MKRICELAERVKHATKTLEIVGKWETPATNYPRTKLGKAQIANFKYSPGIYHHYGVLGYEYYELKQQAIVTNLMIGKQTWMVDDPPHWHAMVEHATNLKGHVLCAGLGLGLIVWCLDAQPQVERITVIEKEQSVIDLIKPLVPQRKLQVLHGDFWDLDPFAMDKPDSVFYDLFVGNGNELYPQAMRVWFQMHECWPGTVRRIHGFNNDELQSLDKLIEKL